MRCGGSRHEPRHCCRTRDARAAACMLDPVLVLMVLSHAAAGPGDGHLGVHHRGFAEERRSVHVRARRSWSPRVAGTACALLLCVGAHRAVPEVRQRAADRRGRAGSGGAGARASATRPRVAAAGSHLGVINLQASEVVRVLVLCWIAAYSVRRAEELRTSFAGLALPLGVTFAVLRVAAAGTGLRCRGGAVRHGLRAAVPRLVRGCAGCWCALPVPARASRRCWWRRRIACSA